MDDGICVSYITEFRFHCEGGHRSCEQCLAPATLAGRGVIELIRADARMFPRGPNFFAWEPPEDLATLGVWQCPLRYSSERVGRQLSKAADYCPYCALLGDPEL